MAEQSGFFDAHLTGGEYDRVYLASSFARYFASFIGNGVFADKAAGLMVYQTNPSTMGVKVLPGQAWINGYWYENDSEFSLPIDIADGVLSRIDLVVLRWGTVERSINLVVKKGTPASNAVAPVVQRDSDYYELKLAEIHVTAGSTSITQANLVDTRADTNTCGWVTGVIKQADTAELFAQWQAAYEAAYAETQAYHAEQKAAWERFFANATEDSVFPVPALEDVGKVPVVSATADGYELKEFLSLLGGTMKGNVDMGGHTVSGLGNPEGDGDALPLGYANKNFAPAGYGLGGAELKPWSSVNSVTKPGFYKFTDCALNGGAATMLVHAMDDWTLAQELTVFTVPVQKYSRSQHGGSWNEWENDALKPYPVGAIYMSLDATSPAELFGGTWEQICGRFLLGVGDNGDGNYYTPNASGGEAFHTLTVDEMPRHNHKIPFASLSAADQAFTWGNENLRGAGDSHWTEETGSNLPHNNMPPYVVVYMWKRIA